MQVSIQYPEFCLLVYKFNSWAIAMIFKPFSAEEIFKKRKKNLTPLIKINKCVFKLHKNFKCLLKNSNRNNEVALMKRQTKEGTTILTLRTIDDNYSQHRFNLQFIPAYFLLDDFKNKILFQEDKWL